MCNKVLLKFLVITLIASLNWPGFWGVIQAGAFFNDIESSKLSTFSTSNLDFSLESDADFLEKVDPQTAVKRSIWVINEGNLNLNYNIEIAFMNGFDNLCGALDLEVYRNNALLSSSSLKNLNINNISLATNTIDVLDLLIRLRSNLIIYQEKTCEFDLIFEGEQAGGSGFSDIEKISNLVNSNTWENIADHLVINKVYYDVAPDQISEERNEWIELYNPSESSINIKKWQICNQKKCVKINSDTSIGANKYILISHDNSTWIYWEIPGDVQTINALGGQFVMDNTSDMLILKDAEGNIIDQMNWGVPNVNWKNYNTDVWNPGVVDAPEGHILGRVPSGQDTDTVDDWQDLSLPLINFKNPTDEFTDPSITLVDEGELGVEIDIDANEESFENDDEKIFTTEEAKVGELPQVVEENPEHETEVVEREIENNSTETEGIMDDINEENATGLIGGDEGSQGNEKESDAQVEIVINEEVFEVSRDVVVEELHAEITMNEPEVEVVEEADLEQEPATDSTPVEQNQTTDKTNEDDTQEEQEPEPIKDVEPALEPILINDSQE